MSIYRAEFFLSNKLYRYKFKARDDEEAIRIVPEKVNKKYPQRKQQEQEYIWMTIWKRRYSFFGKCLLSIKSLDDESIYFSWGLPSWEIIRAVIKA